jgi:hypothetical protein
MTRFCSLLLTLDIALSLSHCATHKKSQRIHINQKSTNRRSTLIDRRDRATNLAAKPDAQRSLALGARERRRYRLRPERPVCVPILNEFDILIDSSRSFDLFGHVPWIEFGVCFTQLQYGERCANHNDVVDFVVVRS